jgi:hypothetical protein
MKGRTNKSEMAEMPKSRKQPADKMEKGMPVMVAGAKRSMKMYGGGETMGTKGTARGMGAAVKGGKFTDL